MLFRSRMEVRAGQVDKFVSSPPGHIRAVLVFGPDQGAVHERANAVARSVVPDLSDPFRVVDLDEAKIASDPACVRDEATALSMTGGRRLVRIRDAGNGITPALAGFLDAPVGDALIVVEAGDLAKGGSLRQLFVRCDDAAAIGCYADNAQTLESLIRASLRRDNLSIEEEALATLVSRLGSDRGVTRAELEKLALYSMDETTITVAQIDAVLGDESALRIDELSDSAGLGEYAELDRMLTRLWASGVAAGTVLRRTMSHFHQLLVIRAEVDHGSNAEEAIRKLRPPVHFSRTRNVLAQARRWPSDRIMQALRHLYEAEALTRTTGVPEQAACSRALFSVAALAQAGHR